MDNQEVRNLVNFILAAGRLKRVERAGWSIRHLPGESVADHTYRTCVLALLLSQSAQVETDTEKVLLMSLFHDLAEGYIGDWDLETTKLVGKNKKHEIEKGVIEQLFALLPEKLMMEYSGLWKEFLEGKSREAKIVHVADKLEALVQAYELEMFGVSGWAMEEFSQGVYTNDIPNDVVELVRAIVGALGR
jgi:putative hydrolase of HD superfamily